MKLKTFSDEEVTKLVSGLTPDNATKIAKAVIESCAKSGNHSAAFTIHNNMDRQDGIPCLVSVQGPFGICICIAPPGASCKFTLIH